MKPSEFRADSEVEFFFVRSCSFSIHDHLRMAFHGTPRLGNCWSIDRDRCRLALGYWGVHYVHIASGEKSNKSKDMIESA